ncbi:hypothetical protein ACSBL2_25080 [Pedobacter sp. AW31-3R]|uniref:hypothetical protein n=1 Tax=Pedobacter sp. AW31-3R TaxID=3445781 RepID=UPI003FA0D937
MYRIVFVNREGNYGILESKNYMVIPSSHIYLKRHGHKIICIIDESHRKLIYQCHDYNWYKDRVELMII